MPLAIMTWLVTAATLNDGVINLKTTGQDYPMLAGNLVALFFSAIVCVVLSFIFPDDYDWSEMRNIHTLEHDKGAELPEDEKAMLDQVRAGAGGVWGGGMPFWVLNHGMRGADR